MAVSQAIWSLEDRAPLQAAALLAETELEELLAGLPGEKQQQAAQLLQNPQALRQLLESPQAQALLRGLMGR